MKLFRRKHAADLQFEAKNDNRLKRALGPVNLTALGIGAIIGAGIFVLTGQVAAKYAGPAVTISFVLASLACTFAGLCYAEFSALIPASGSAYTYGYATLGEFVAWIIGWDLILEYLFAGATVAVGWSGYAVSLLKDFGIVIPAQFTAAPFEHNVPPDAGWNIWRLFTGGWVSTGAMLNVPAMAIVGFVTILLVIGIKESTTFNNVIVAIKLTVILTFITVGFMFIKRHNWHPFVPPNIGDGQFGWSGVLRGAGVIFFAYIGFDAVSTTAQEARNPQRDLPIGMLVSLGLCTVLYIVVSLILCGVVNYQSLNVSAPIAVAVDVFGKKFAWLGTLVKVGAIAGLSSVILVLLLGQPRIFYAMSKDGLLPKIFSAVHPRFQTPWFAQIVTGALAMLIAGLFPISLIGELVSIGTLLAFVIVCAGVLVLRKLHPEMNRPFRTPAIWLVAPLGIICCGGLMASLPRDTWARLIVWMALGFVIYFGYSHWRSKLHK